LEQIMPDPHVLKAPSDMTLWSDAEARAGRSLGLVPTMGALHVGHRSLIERARRENDRIVVSIFVNPTQFGPDEDFHRYPRPFDADLKLCAAIGVDAVFAPEKEDMYRKDARTWVDVGGLSDTLCGLSRPGHFRGVCTVVAKLFNIVRPNRAYFGRKDAQQLRILQAMAYDLNFSTEIVPCEIVREPDGIALSSRNKYLSPEQREQARSLSRALEHARQRIASGARDAMKLVGEVTEILQKEPDAEIDYVQIVDADTLKDLDTIRGRVLIALAVKIGTTRLIDNVELTVSHEG